MILRVAFRAEPRYDVRLGPFSRVTRLLVLRVSPAMLADEHRVAVCRSTCQRTAIGAPTAAGGTCAAFRATTCTQSCARLRSCTPCHGPHIWTSARRRQRPGPWPCHPCRTRLPPPTAEGRAAGRPTEVQCGGRLRPVTRSIRTAAFHPLCAPMALGMAAMCLRMLGAAGRAAGMATVRQRTQESAGARCALCIM